MDCNFTCAELATIGISVWTKLRDAHNIYERGESTGYRLNKLQILHDKIKLLIEAAERLEDIKFDVTDF